MEIDLTGKSALVGGSTGGIGKAIATRLAASGASVFLMARNKSKLEKVVNESVSYTHLTLPTILLV